MSIRAAIVILLIRYPLAAQTCSHTFRWQPQGAVQAFRNGKLIPADQFTVSGLKAAPVTFADQDLISWFYLRKVSTGSYATIEETTVCTGNLNPPSPTISSLRLSPASTVPGGTISMDLAFSTTTPSTTAGLQWSFLYGTSDVAAISVTPGPAATAASKTVTCASSTGIFTCLATGINTNSIAPGVIATLNVTLNPTVIQVAIGVSNTIGATLAGNLFPVSGMGADITATNSP